MSWFILTTTPSQLEDIKIGRKIVEGVSGKSTITVGDRVFFIQLPFPYREVETIITARTTYPSFREMLKYEGVNNVIPQLCTINEGVKEYRKDLTKEEEEENGVVALRFCLVY